MTPVDLIFSTTLSIKTAKRNGDNTPSWRTPANSRKKCELYLFHFTHVTDMLNHNSNIRKISSGSFLSINLLNKAERLIRSNALLKGYRPHAFLRCWNMSTARLLAFAVARAVIKLFRTSPGPIVADFKSLFFLLLYYLFELKLVL